MKITGAHGPYVTHPSKQRTQGKSGKSEFEKIMEQAINGGRTSSTQAPNLMGVKVLEGLKPIGQIVSETTKVTVNQIESILDKLEYYASKLGDNSIQIGDLAPLMDDMESDIIVLEKMRSNSRIPSGLDKIASDLVATITAEIEKFRRGDYL